MPDLSSLAHLTHWHWLALGIILLIAEVAVSGGFLLWIGLSAVGVSIMVWLAPRINYGTQLLMFGGGAVLASFLWWHYLRRHPVKTDDPALNRRNTQYINQKFVLVEAIANGRGKVRINDSVWLVTGPDLPKGAVVIVTHAEGTLLTVKPDAD